MKNIVSILILLITFQAFPQEHKKFKSGVKVSTIEKAENYQKPTSVLFVFKGHTHLVSFFLDLEKHLKRRFKKEIKNGFTLDLVYDLHAKDPFESDLALIPKRDFDKTQYEAIAFVSISDFKTWDKDLYKKRKQNYNLNIVLKDPKSTKLLSLVLNVSSYYTITNENKKSSKLIYKQVMLN